jgi:tetratricopeptide (TPR) repeat protein
LGEGGKGLVFLCQDTVLERNVAIKVIKEEVLDPEGLLRFQREVQAMGRLLHPHVVTVFDIGNEAGKHFVVLEFMEGGDLENLIVSSAQKRLNAATAVRIVKDVGKALEHAHSHGILHRDIKPANIWLTQEGLAKLGDFGLAYLGGSLKITRAGMMVGSVAYMAPEVALGRQADARSDLYMLGATLYEMVTGRVPFTGDDPVKVIFSHINDLPLSPRRFAPEIPDTLESLIFKLLSKDPEQRPKSAGDVLRALEDVEKQVEVVSVPVLGAGTAPAQSQRPPSPEPRFAQPLVGREAELTALRQRVDSALRGEGSVVFLTGEAGIGKTRLAGELRGYARGRGFLWLEGMYPKEGGILSQALVEAIRSFLRTALPALLVKVVMPYAGELVRLVPELSERLGKIPAPPPLGPEEERLRLLETIAGFFTSISKEEPLVLFVDDVQWASSLDALQHLARKVPTEKLLVLGAYRDVELEESSTLSRTLLSMNRERLFHALALKRLSQSQVSQMVTQIVGEPASVSLSKIIYEKTEGNPFFVEETVRYLIEGGAVALGDKGWEVKDAALLQLPRSVKAVVSERLERLGEEAKTVLTWASMVGREFTLEELREVTGLEEEKLLDAIERALEARVVSARSSLSREAYGFVDNQTRDVLYEGISPVRRGRYHLRAGQALEKVHARRLEEHYDALTRHFIEGRDLQKAAEYSIKAGDRVAGIYAWERAISHYQTALELLEEIEAEPVKQAEVLEKLGTVTALAKGRGSIGYLEKALSIYEAAGDNKKAAAVHGRLAVQYGVREVGGQDVKKGHFHASRAVALLEREVESPELATAYKNLGLMVHFRGRERAPSAIQLVEKGLTIAERLGDLRSVAEAAQTLGPMLVMVGTNARGVEICHKGFEAAKAAGDPVGFTLGAVLFSYYIALLRDSQSALEWAQKAVDSSESAGAFRDKILSRLAMVWAYTLRGEVGEAIANMGKAEQLAHSRGVELSEFGAVTASVPRLFYFFLGDWDRAEAELLRWLKIGAHLGELAHECWLWLGPLYVERGDIPRARKLLQEYTATLKELEKKTYELHLRTILVQARSALGELEEAQNDLQRCNEILSNGEDWRGLAAEVYQAEGILRTDEKRWPEAEAAFQKAVEINRQYHLPYFEAKTLFERGQMCLSRNESGDRDRGMQLLDEALAIFQRVPAKKMVEKVLSKKQMVTS